MNRAFKKCSLEWLKVGFSVNLDVWLFLAQIFWGWDPVFLLITFKNREKSTRNSFSSKCQSITHYHISRIHWKQLIFKLQRKAKINIPADKDVCNRVILLSNTNPLLESSNPEYVHICIQQRSSFQAIKIFRLAIHLIIYKDILCKYNI